MPTGSTALDVIKTAMRHLGVIATGETPSAAEAADGLASLNDVLETWNTDGLTVWASSVQAYTATPNDGVYSVGPTGDFVTARPRPVRITGIYGSYQGVDYAVAEWSYAEYMAVTVKQTAALYPTRYAYVNDYPNGQLYLWPVPTAAITLNINMQVQIASVPALTTVLSFPPGYARSLAWDLAAEMAPQYGIVLTPQQVALVNASKAAIKKSNHSPTISTMDPALTHGPLPTWQGG